ncbi:MAG: thioesterase [Aureispira sp.]|nr:thioesterase [Aureispira sp.]
MEYYKEVEVIWANLDANMHMGNTSYSEFATHARVSFFNDFGYSLARLSKEGIGPILLKEELVYWREVNMHEHLKVYVELDKASEDYSKYTLVQNIHRCSDGKKAARVTIHGAWLDLHTRQLIKPPEQLVKMVIDNMNRTKNFKFVGMRDYMFF